jgi:hypothetical protein
MTAMTMPACLALKCAPFRLFFLGRNRAYTRVGRLGGCFVRKDEVALISGIGYLDPLPEMSILGHPVTHYKQRMGAINMRF